MSTADKLLYLQGTKSAIKDAIVAKGIDIPNGTPFREYATKIGDITAGTTGSEIADTWVRPAEWLALPDNVDGVQKVSILNAVFDTDSEFVAMIFEGDYTVDWGDGTIENFASGVKAEHKYEYSNVNLNSDTVAKFGYKQCVITITPQAGNNLTVIDLNKYPSLYGDTRWMFNILDININAQYCTNLWLGCNNASTEITIMSRAQFKLLESVNIGELNCTSLLGLFSSCKKLQNVSIKSTTSVSVMSYMFNSCISLKSIPDLDYSNCTTLSNFATRCYRLKELGHFNTTSALTVLTSFANNCENLTKAATFDNTHYVTDVASMYYGAALTTFPDYDFYSVTTINITVNTPIEIFPAITFGPALTSVFVTPLGSSHIKRMLAPIPVSFIVNGKMGANDLNEMYTILPTVTGKTVTVAGNYGVSGDDPTIATAKGWTVVG